MGKILYHATFLKLHSWTLLLVMENYYAMNLINGHGNLNYIHEPYYWS